MVTASWFLIMKKKLTFLGAVEVWTIVHTQLPSGERGAMVACLKRSCKEGFFGQETKMFSQCGWPARCNVKCSGCQPRSVDFPHSLWGLLDDCDFLLFFSFLNGSLRGTWCASKLTLTLQVELHLSWHSDVVLKILLCNENFNFFWAWQYQLAYKKSDLDCLSSHSTFKYSCEKLMKRKRANECHCSVKIYIYIHFIKNCCK